MSQKRAQNDLDKETDLVKLIHRLRQHGISMLMKFDSHALYHAAKMARRRPIDHIELNGEVPLNPWDLNETTSRREILKI